MTHIPDFKTGLCVHCGQKKGLWTPSCKKTRGTSGNKFNAEASVCRLGHNHRSKGECELCDNVLQVQVIAGEIANLRYEEMTWVCPMTGIRWKIDWDFDWVKLKYPGFVEFKGVEMPEFRKNLKVYRVTGDRRLDIWKKNKRGLYLHETVIPQGWRGAS